MEYFIKSDNGVTCGPYKTRAAAARDAKKSGWAICSQPDYADAVYPRGCTSEEYLNATRGE